MYEATEDIRTHGPDYLRGTDAGSELYTDRGDVTLGWTIARGLYGDGQVACASRAGDGGAHDGLQQALGSCEQTWRQHRSHERIAVLPRQARSGQVDSLASALTP